MFAMSDALTPSEVYDFISHALMIREIPYIAGPPGIGKSEIVAQIAKDFGLKLLDIRLSQMLPEDLTGIPSLNSATGKADYNPFSTFPMEGDPIPAGFNGWLIFLDELSSASEENFAAIYSFLLGHKLGGHKVHPKAVIVAAGNRTNDSGVSRELPDTLITRMLPITMKASHIDWINWATDPLNNIHDTVVDFIKKHQDLLNSTVDPTQRWELETFPTPRGWNKASKIMHFHDKQAKKNQITRKDAAGIPMEQPSSTTTIITPIVHKLLEAAVGISAAKAFQEFHDESIQLPYPWEVAQSPSSVRIPSNHIGKAKLTADLADFFIGTQDQSRDALIQFMNRMNEGEYSALFCQTLIEKMGNTKSDQKLINNVKKRLNVDDINVPNDQSCPLYLSNPLSGKGVSHLDPDSLFVQKHLSSLTVKQIRGLLE